MVFAFWLRTVPAGHPDSQLAFNVFYYLFARNEPAGLLLVALFSAGAALWFRRSQPLVEDRPVENGILTGWACIAVAVVVFAIAAIGTQTVFHNYLVTADEYLADFQARILLRGEVQAQVGRMYTASGPCLAATAGSRCRGGSGSPSPGRNELRPRAPARAAPRPWISRCSIG